MQTRGAWGRGLAPGTVQLVCTREPIGLSFFLPDSPLIVATENPSPTSTFSSSVSEATFKTSSFKKKGPLLSKGASLRWVTSEWIQVHLYGRLLGARHCAQPREETQPLLLAPFPQGKVPESRNLAPNENDRGGVLSAPWSSPVGQSALRRAGKSCRTELFSLRECNVHRVSNTLPGAEGAGRRPGSRELALRGEPRGKTLGRRKTLAMGSLALCVYQAGTQPVHSLSLLLSPGGPVSSLVVPQRQGARALSLALCRPPCPRPVPAPRALPPQPS